MLSKKAVITISEEIKCGIYCIQNKINGKRYIGQSKNIKRRINEHFKEAFRPKCESYNYPIKQAIRKYGKENFRVIILEECDEAKLDEREIYWIDFFASVRNGYNISSGGIANDGGVKLNRDIANQIIDLLKNTTIEIKDIAKKFGITSANVSQINHGKIWMVNSEKYPIRPIAKKEKPEKPKRNNFSCVTREMLIEDFKNMSEEEVAAKYNTTLIGLKGLRINKRVFKKDIQQPKQKYFCKFCGKEVRKGYIYCSKECLTKGKSQERKEFLENEYGINKTVLENSLNKNFTISSAAKSLSVSRTTFRKACKLFSIPGVK